MGNHFCHFDHVQTCVRVLLMSNNGDPTQNVCVCVFLCGGSIWSNGQLVKKNCLSLVWRILKCSECASWPIKSKKFDVFAGCQIAALQVWHLLKWICSGVWVLLELWPHQPNCWNVLFTLIAKNIQIHTHTHTKNNTCQPNSMVPNIAILQC